jgi:hypothetical protein
MVATPTQPGSQAPGPSAAKPDQTSGTEANAAGERDPIRELLDALSRAAPKLERENADLARRAEAIVRQAAEPGRSTQPQFRHDIAYLVQDIERSAIGQLPLTVATQSEVTRLAGSAPGLENERMLSLMRSTASIDDRGLIRDIRRAGAGIGREIDQNTPNVRSQIESLESRVRLTARPADAAPEVQPGDSHAGTAPAASPRVQSDTAGAVPTRSAPQRQPSRGALDTILTGIRGPSQGTGAPWDPPLTPMADRITGFQQRMMEGRDEIGLRNAEKSGRAAMEALDGFRNGEGATIMNRIRDAARSEPGGMAAVLSEMREGGRFADLRQQFNAALADERGVAQAYDKAAGALARYGQDRTAVEQVISRRPDAANLTAKFEQMDAQIGEAAGSTPSRRDGKSMIEDLAKQAAELIQRAVDAVKSAFSRQPAAEAGARAAPAPSMSA